MGFSVDQFEKAHYPFKRYPKASCEVILFPGCSFPSQFPKTMDALTDICNQHGVGIAYDCCGVSLLSRKDGKDARRILNSIRKRLQVLGCKRLVCMCPNCFYYLRDHLDVELISIYKLLSELGIVQKGQFEDGSLFVPCPDRKERIIENEIREFYDLGSVRPHVKGCCGLRADIMAKGPEFAKKCGSNVANSVEGKTLYTYCASCSGQFKRLGFDDVLHVLPELLGRHESPDAAHAIMNRAKRKFDKRVDPMR